MAAAGRQSFNTAPSGIGHRARPRGLVATCQPAAVGKLLHRTGPDDARINYPVALSVLSQQIGSEGRPRNYLYCTGWDVKPRSIIPSLAAAAAVDCFL